MFLVFILSSDMMYKKVAKKTINKVSITAKFNVEVRSYVSCLFSTTASR